MSVVTAEQVKGLRERTGAGMMECKKALLASGGDLEKAIEQLRKDGILKAAKKAGRATEEGLIGAFVLPDGSAGGLVEVNCETDFVARTDDFQAFVAALARQAAEPGADSVAALLAKPWAGGGAATVEAALKALIAKLGENMEIRRVLRLAAGSGEKIGHYVHAGSRLGVLVALKGGGGKATPELLKDVAMHIAAMNPAFLRPETVPAAVVEKEKEIVKSQLEPGKPAEVQEKIVAGKVRRFFTENCLLEQIFVKDPAGKKTVGQHLKQADPQLDVAAFVRFQVGEEKA